MTIYLLMTGLGLLLALGAYYTDRVFARSEVAFAATEPAVPQVCFLAKTTGMMIAAAGIGAALCVALT